MTLITSISGIRGIIGGKQGEGLTPPDIVRFTTAYAVWVNQQETGKKKKIVIGRDARITGELVSQLVSGTLMAMGMDVIDLGLSTTPTVELAVMKEKAAGGLILTASHNPKAWNALKLLNDKGEFLDAKEGEEILKLAADKDTVYAEANKTGNYTQLDGYIEKHIDLILKLPLVDVKAIKEKKYKIVVDAVNSTGGISVPPLLEKLGVEVVPLYCEPNGMFPHNPEPVPANLSTLSAEVVKQKADMGIAVDPDVDRLVMVSDDGSMFGEEYTLVAVADYILQHKKGATVSNLSSTRALQDITEKVGCEYFASAVGEVNVVKKMKEVNAVIGGEGNGGVIYPDLHYGRDALVGIALFLTHLAKSGKRISLLKNRYPYYYIAKHKVKLEEGIDMDHIFKQIKNKYKKNPSNTVDGLKIDFDNDWVHLRKSNTEPIIRIYTESPNERTAENMAEQIKQDIKAFMQEKKG